MLSKKLFYIVFLLSPCFGYSQVFPINFNYYDFVPDHIDNYFGEADSLLLVNNIQKVTTLYRAKESDSLRLFRVQYFDKGRRVKDERYELSTGKLERLIHYTHSPGKLEVEMMHYPSVENGYRLPARHFRYLLNADYVHPYQSDSLGRIKINLRYIWQSNEDILYETFDFRGNCIVNEMMTLKPDAFQMLQRPKPSYPRIVRKSVDEYHNEEFHYNKWGKLHLYKSCHQTASNGLIDQLIYDDNGLLIHRRGFDDYQDSHKMKGEYIYINE